MEIQPLKRHTQPLLKYLEPPSQEKASTSVLHSHRASGLVLSPVAWRLRAVGVPQKVSLPRACHYWSPMRLTPVTCWQVVLSPSVWLLLSPDRIQLLRPNCSPPCRFSRRPACPDPGPLMGSPDLPSSRGENQGGVGSSGPGQNWMPTPRSGHGELFTSSTVRLLPCTLGWLFAEAVLFPWMGTLVFRVPHAR